jgi:phenylpyruvate tautomerase PptA (4-oxalocrotonate tautomerase family)
VAEKASILRINLLKTERLEQKKKLAEAITEDYVKVLGVKKDMVIIIYNDLPRTDLVKGRTSGSEWKK